jgi:uncharacterized membrane protein YbhN (UPF0104 family)
LLIAYREGILDVRLIEQLQHFLSFAKVCRSMQLPKSLLTRSFAVLGVSIAVYACVVIYFGWDALREQLSRFPRGLLVPIGLLSLVNYALRFWRWQVYLRSVGAVLPLRDSLGLYFASYVMVLTPGKVGEVFKAGVLREQYGLALSRGLPLVLAERIFDFLAVMILSAGGAAFWPGPLQGLATGLVGAATVAVCLALFQARSVRDRLVNRAAGSPLLARHRVGLDESANTLGQLLGLRLGSFSLLVSTVAWLAECMGLWLVCRGVDFPLPIGQAVFVYAAATLAGSLSFLPGGLGGTETVLIWLLQVVSMPRTAAATAALVVRLFTLWLAVVVGLGFFVAFRHHFRGRQTDETRPS